MTDRDGPGDGAESRPLRSADLLAVAALAALTLGAVTALEGPMVRAVVSLPFLAFGPGYALLAWIESPDASGARPRSQRLARAAAASLFVTSVLGLLVAAAPVPTTQFAVTAAVAPATVVLAAAGAARRRRRDGAPSLSMPLPTDGPGLPTGTLVLTAVFLLLSLGYVGFLAPAPEGFSSLSVRPASEDPGASIQSLSITPGEENALVVGVDNHEREPTNYTVVARVERVEGSGETATVIGRSDARRFEFALAREESWETRHEVTPESGEGRLRVAYYLYRGEAPPEADGATAYRTATVWETE